MSVSGTFRSKARRLTSTTSPSSSVGRIDPDGIGFQSATAVRKRPKSRRKTMKPRLLRIHLGIPGLRVVGLSNLVARDRKYPVWFGARGVGGRSPEGLGDGSGRLAALLGSILHSLTQ